MLSHQSNKMIQKTIHKNTRKCYSAARKHKKVLLVLQGVKGPLKVHKIKTGKISTPKSRTTLVRVKCQSKKVCLQL